MKKLLSVLVAAALCAGMLAGCTGSSSSGASSSESSSSSTASATDDTASDAASSETTEAVADPEKVASIVTALEAVNPIANPMVIDDFYVQNTMGIDPESLLAFQGDVTNEQADCALVFVAQAKSGKADEVKTALEALKESMSSSLYLEYADKVAKAQDARIVVNGDYIVMVIAGVNGPDYSDIDTAIESAMA